jgi:hypothetical protein
VRGEGLDGHVAVEGHIERFEHHAHSAFADHAPDFIAADSSQALRIVRWGQPLQDALDLRMAGFLAVFF